MNSATLASWLIVAGLALIAAQVIVSIVTAVKTKNEKEKEDPTTEGLGTFLADVLKLIVAAVPLGGLGFLLILVGAIIGGYLSIPALFPPTT